MPLGDSLPALIREDSFAHGLCGGLDEVLAPVMLTLDTFPAYLDLAYAPEDMLDWLASWLGMTVDPSQDLSLQRRLLQSSSELHALRGTRRGMELAVEAALGLDVEIEETGAATWSSDPDADLPGQRVPEIVVRVRARGEQDVDLGQVDALVTSLKPAHVRHRVHVVTD